MKNCAAHNLLQRARLKRATKSFFTPRISFSLVLLILAIAYPSFAKAESNRIVSLKPNITAILISLKAENKIAGITNYCRWPFTKEVPHVADYLGPKPEAVIALKPDLVLGSEENSLRSPIDSLRNAGINVVLLPFDSATDIAGSIEQIGRLVGSSNANALASDLRLAMQPMKVEKSKTAILAVGATPFVIAGQKTFLSDLMASVGLKNAAPDRGKYPRISQEELALLKPNIIIDITPTGVQVPDPSFNVCIIHLLADDFQPALQLIDAKKKLQKDLKDVCGF